MNYIELINNMWSLREQGLLTAHECDLYLYLVHRSNRLGWKNPFTQPTDIACAVLGINRNALSIRRSRLRQLGLIAFKDGERKTKPPVYTLLNPVAAQATTPLLSIAGMEDVKASHAVASKASKSAEVDYQQVVAVFNQSCPSLASVKKLSPQRMQKIAIAVSRHGLTKLYRCFKLAEESHFLSKRKDKWRATFDWIIDPENMVKILEGCYGSEGKNDVQNQPKADEKAAAEQYGADKWATTAAKIARATA